MNTLHECCDIERRRKIIRRHLLYNRLSVAVRLLAGMCFIVGSSIFALIACGIVGGSSPGGTTVSSAVGMFSGHLLWDGVIIATVFCAVGVSLSWVAGLISGDH